MRWNPMLGPALALLFFICVLPRIVDAAVAPGGNVDPNNDGSHFAYGENIGWINFKPAFGDGVTVTDAAVTGFAWGENVGWINFTGVFIDPTGHLSGFAWGENVGFISFDIPTNDATLFRPLIAPMMSGGGILLTILLLGLSGTYYLKRARGQVQLA
jgi:hypothetical protein